MGLFPFEASETVPFSYLPAVDNTDKDQMINI